MNVFQGNMYKDIDLAWCAGIIDGDGCISISKNHKTYTLNLIVGMTHEETIKVLKFILKLGSITLSLKQLNCKDCYFYNLYADNAAKIIEFLSPYLFTKKEQVLIAKEFEKHCLKQKDVIMGEILYEEMSILNKKGKQIVQKELISESDWLPLWKDIDFAWVAGIIDSEGSIQIRKVKHHYKLRLSVKMTHLQTLVKLKQILKVGETYKNPIESNPKWKDAFQYVASGKNVLRAIKLIFQYLRTKKEQALVALEFGEKCLYNPGKGAVPMDVQLQRVTLYERMADLNKRGKHDEI